MYDYLFECGLSYLTVTIYDFSYLIKQLSIFGLFQKIINTLILIPCPFHSVRYLIATKSVCANSILWY